LLNYQRAYAKINLDCIRDNLIQIKKKINQQSKVMIVIKDDGYGHGAVPIAKELENYYDQIAVSNFNEGYTIRKEGIKKPILILGYSSEVEYEDIIKNDIMITVINKAMAEKISKIAKALNITAKIHIKIETGMGRVGFFTTNESINDIIDIAKLPNIKIEGIFTHFAKADHFDKTFTYKQIEHFKDFNNTLIEKGINIPTIHASNSAGVIDLEDNDTYFNMVRPGIILYGLYPSKEVKKNMLIVKPALSLISEVFFIKEVEENTPIGYGGTFITKRESKIATIPIGYGDGYPRGLSSRGRVLINGEYAPIVGRICMDQLMVDVTDIENINEGDEVVLIGKQGNNEILADEIADLTDTISYEIVCGINKRVPRVYYYNNKELYVINYN